MSPQHGAPSATDGTATTSTTRPGLGRRRATTAPVLLAAGLAVLLGACTGTGSGASSDAAGSVAEGAAGVGAAETGAAEAGAAEAGAAQAADATTAGVTPATGRQVVTTGSVAVVVTDPDDAVTRITALVEGAGGRVDALDQQVATADSPASASMTTRVPAAALTGVLTALADVGEVGARSITSSDVTTAATDLDARTAALEASVQRLQGLITEAATTADVIAAEAELTSRQGELESLRQQRALLAEQVDLSTLTIALTTEAPEAEVRPGGFFDGLDTGLDALVRALAVGLVVLGVLLPWAALAGLLLAAVVGVRRWRRRRAARRTPAGGVSGA